MMADQKIDLGLQTLEAEALALARGIHRQDSKAVIDALSHLLDRAVAYMPREEQVEAYEIQIRAINLAWAIHLRQWEAAGRALTALAEKINERFGDEKLEIGPFLGGSVELGSENEYSVTPRPSTTEGMMFPNEWPAPFKDRPRSMFSSSKDDDAVPSP